jgi:hypothetical protein
VTGSETLVAWLSTARRAQQQSGARAALSRRRNALTVCAYWASHRYAYSGHTRYHYYTRPVDVDQPCWRTVSLSKHCPPIWSALSMVGTGSMELAIGAAPLRVVSPLDGDRVIVNSSYRMDGRRSKCANSG